MTVHHYPFRAVRADYFSAGTGLALSVVPLVMGTTGVVAAVLVPAAALFGAYALRTAYRQMTRVTVSEARIEISGPRSASLPWGSLTTMSLGYYSAWRDGAGGWMQLRLGSAGRIIRLESTIEGFHDIVRRAVEGAMASELDLDAATVSNLDMLGIDVPKGRVLMSGTAPGE